MTPADNRPLDTSPEAWAVYLSAMQRMTGGEAMARAIDLSEVVHAFRLAGIQAEHPEWDRRQVVRCYIAEAHGVQIED